MEAEECEIGGGLALLKARATGLLARRARVAAAKLWVVAGDVGLLSLGEAAAVLKVARVAPLEEG
jgi:hypothetical protein